MDTREVIEMYRWKKIYILKRDNKVLFINFDEKKMFRVSFQIYHYIYDNIICANKEDIEVKYQPLIEFLVENQIISDGNEDTDSDNKGEINSIYFLPTLQCNLICDFCSLSSSPFIIEPKPMALEFIKDMIMKLSDLKVHKFVITGGEPFCSKNIFNIINLVNKNLDCKLQICTNGLLLNNEVIERIQGKVQMLDISIENILEDSCFLNKQVQKQQFMDKIDILIKIGFQVCLSFVLTKKNQELVFEFLDICYEKRTAISVKVIEKIGRAEENEELLVSKEEAETIMVGIYKYIAAKGYDTPNFEEFLFPVLLPQKACAGYGHLLSVYPDGSIYNCFMLNYSSFRLGNLSQDSMDDILNRLHEKKESDLFKKCFIVCNKQGCTTCEINDFCEGHCHYCNSNGQAKVKENIQCYFIRKLYLFILWYFKSNETVLENLDRFLELYYEIETNKTERMDLSVK